MTGRGRIAGWLALPLLAAAAPARDDAAPFRALRAVDARLAAVGFRLATANAALCRDLQPGTGAVLHALDQYDPASRPAALAAFGFPAAAPVSVEAVVPGSPAERAGVRADDGVLAIDGRSLPPATAGPATVATRDAAAALVEGRRPAAPLPLLLVRDGRSRVATLMPVPECRVGFELLLGSRLVAHSDGRQVQIGVGYLARYDRDEPLAVIVAHEMAHVVLRHRARLEAAGVKWGLLGQVGRNARLFRRTEDDADRLSVALLRNAGYDPAIAVAFWRHDVGDLDGGVLHAPTHASSKARAEAIAAEIAGIPAGAPVPYVPPVLATRDEVLR